MTSRLSSVLAALLLLCAGCDSIHQKQYRIHGVAEGSAEADELKLLLGGVADDCGLKDRTAESGVPGTLAWYVEPVESGFRVELGARYYQTDVLVDLLGGFGGMRGSKTFQRAGRQLRDVLTERYGKRLTVPDPPVPVSHGK